jgi:iron(III) transport system ATP-binding protein
MGVSIDGTVPAADAMTWTGQVVQSIFRGTHRSLIVETPAGRLNIDVPAFTNPETGSTVTVVADRQAAWATPA